jgi:hypothetical protein
VTHAFSDLTHQIRSQSFFLIDWHLCDLSLLVDVRALDGLEFQVPCDSGVNQEFHEQAIGHQELGNQVNVPVTSATVFVSGIFLLELGEKFIKGSDGS